jgi:hypothetical protein
MIMTRGKFKQRLIKAKTVSDLYTILEDVKEGLCTLNLDTYRDKHWEKSKQELEIQKRVVEQYLKGDSPNEVSIDHS